MIKKLLISFIGYILRKLRIVHNIYMTRWINNRLGHAGLNATIHYPYNIIGENNIFLDNHVSIGAGSTIYTKNAKVFFGEKSFTGPNITIISGDHPYVTGQYMLDIRKKDLLNNNVFDKDIIIEQDVWIGANVTILKGVRIGRCAIIAAGSVIVNDIPPYSIVGGIPAKVIKFKWDINNILIHEQFIIQNEANRMNKDEIEKIINLYNPK